MVQDVSFLKCTNNGADVLMCWWLSRYLRCYDSGGWPAIIWLILTSYKDARSSEHWGMSIDLDSNPDIRLHMSVKCLSSITGTWNVLPSMIIDIPDWNHVLWSTTATTLRLTNISVLEVIKDWLKNIRKFGLQYIECVSHPVNRHKGNSCCHVNWLSYFMGKVTRYTNFLCELFLFIHYI